MVFGGLACTVWPDRQSGFACYAVSGCDNWVMVLGFMQSMRCCAFMSSLEPFAGTDLWLHRNLPCAVLRTCGDQTICCLAQLCSAWHVALCACAVSGVVTRPSAALRSAALGFRWLACLLGRSWCEKLVQGPPVCSLECGDMTICSRCMCSCVCFLVLAPPACGFVHEVREIWPSAVACEMGLVILSLLPH